MKSFHYAYNGIPTKRYDSPFFRDSEPTPLDHLNGDTYSGTLKLTIKTKTPLIAACHDKYRRLVVPSASGKDDGAKNDEDAFIPATSLKGVISSAFEEVTSSRFRVFGDDHRKAQFRYTTDHPTMWKTEKIPSWQTAFLRAEIGSDGPQWTIHLQQCALLPDSAAAEVKFHNKEQYIDTFLSKLRVITPHLSKVDSFEAFEQGDSKDTKLIVSKIKNFEVCISNASNPITCNGYIVRLTQVPDDGVLRKTDRLIGTKYYEYVFYEDKEHLNPQHIQLTRDNALVSTILKATQIALTSSKGEKRGKHTLIQKVIDYHNNSNTTSNRKNKLTADTVYNFLVEEASTKPGIPLFAREVSDGQWELAYSQLGRSISPNSHSPSDLALNGKINPAPSIVEASAADRLWGFVAPDSSKNKPPSLKGRIYLSNARMRSLDNKTFLKRGEAGKGWIPPILAGPKPWTAQPYLRSKAGEGIFGLVRSKCFTSEHSLIRKTYPTHRLLFKNTELQFLKCNPVKKTKKASEVLIGSYILPGATFESELRFEGLTAEEISIMLWLLTPSNLVPKGQQKEGERGYFHLGFGKPLGLGSASICAEVLTLTNSKLLASQYRDLKAVLALDKTKCSDEDRKTLTEELALIKEKLPSPIREQTSLAVKAFVRSAYGWKNDESANKDPVSYSPSAFRPKKQGFSTITDYFTEYERSRILNIDFNFKMSTLEEDSEDVAP